MKAKITCFLLSLFLLSGVAFATDFSNDGMILAPGDMVANVGIGGGFTVGMEKGIKKFDLGTIPVTLGVTGRLSSQWTFKYFDVDAMATLHLALAAFDFAKESEWMSNIEWYAGFGYGVGIYSYYSKLYYYPGFTSMSGISYTFSDKYAVYAEYTSSSSTLGLKINL